MTASEVLIPSALAVLAATIFGLESMRRAHGQGSIRVLSYPRWTWCLVLGLVFLAGLAVWSKIWGSDVQRQEDPVLVGILTALFLATAIYLAMFFNATVWLDAAGVHAKPAFRKQRFIPWEAISAVRAKGGSITIDGPRGLRIDVSGLMIGIRELRAELASRIPDRLPAGMRADKPQQLRSGTPRD